MSESASTELKTELDAAHAAATKQGDTVRSLKAMLKDGKAEKVLLWKDVVP